MRICLCFILALASLRRPSCSSMLRVLKRLLKGTCGNAFVPLCFGDTTTLWSQHPENMLLTPCVHGDKAARRTAGPLPPLCQPWQWAGSCARGAPGAADHRGARQSQVPGHAGALPGHPGGRRAARDAGRHPAAAQRPAPGAPEHAERGWLRVWTTARCMPCARVNLAPDESRRPRWQKKVSSFPLSCAGHLLQRRFLCAAVLPVLDCVCGHVNF